MLEKLRASLWIAQVGADRGDQRSGHLPAGSVPANGPTPPALAVNPPAGQGAPSSGRRSVLAAQAVAPGQAALRVLAGAVAERACLPPPRSCNSLTAIPVPFRPGVLPACYAETAIRV